MICHKKEDKPTTYTKSEVDGLLTGKATITCVDNAIAHQSTRTTNTLNIKSDLVQFKGVNNIAYMNTLPTGISAYTNLYTDGTAQFKSGISVQEQKGINTWAVKCDISHNPAIFFQKVMDPLQEQYLQYVKITSMSGNNTSPMGNVSASGNLQSYHGNITAPNGNMSGQSIASTSTITATGNLTTT